METLTPVKPNSDERTWGMLTHFSSILGFFFPFGGIVGPLIAWSVKKHESDFVDKNGKEAVNFNLTWTIAAAIFWILWLSQFFGKIILLIVNAEHFESIEPEEFPTRLIINMFVFFIPIIFVYLFRFILMLVGTIQSSNGSVFRYPLSYRFIK
ncbi:MAG: DUF4870 domain-containing protein [Bacteroidetes bacterium]|nr:DUF4870 domain-containing protein [Bacteroidota bacterium]